MAKQSASQSKLSAKLQEAVDQGNWRVIRQLISTGAPPDTPTEWGSTALMAAATLDHKDAPKHVMFLVEHGSKVDQRSEDGLTPLIAAAGCSGDYVCAIVKALMAKGADVNASANDGTTALLVASRQVALALVKDLLAAGANPNCATEAGATPLLEVLQAGSDDALGAVDLLLGAGADVNHADTESARTALLATIDNFSDATPGIVARLFEAGADPRTASKSGRTALIALASSWGGDSASQVLKACVEQGADVNAVDDEGRSALSYAAGEEAGLEPVKYFLARGASVDRADTRNVTPLMYASSAGCLGIVQLLLEHGASVAAADESGRTSLRDAVDSRQDWKTGHLDVARVLVDRGADVNATDAYGVTVLMAAARHEGSLKIVQFLLERGADAAKIAVNGHSVLRSAAESGDLTLVKALFELGARDPRAAAWSQEEMVARFLLDNGCDIQAVDQDGESLLYRAVSYGWSPKFVGRLIDGGCDPNMRNIGCAPIDKAMCRGRDWEVIREISRRGGQESIRYPYYVEIARETSAAAAARKLKPLKAAIKQYEKALRIRNDAEDAIWQEPASEGGLHRAGLVFQAESSLPAFDHVFRALSGEVSQPLLVCDFLTNTAQRYLDGARDDGNENDSLLDIVRLRPRLEEKGLCGSNDINFALVPVWRIFGDCCLRQHNGVGPVVDGIAVSFDGFSQTEDGEDNEDEPTFVVTIDTGESQCSFYGALLECQGLARVDWEYIAGKYEEDYDGTCSMPREDFEALVRQNYEISTVPDYDQLLVHAAIAGDIQTMQLAKDAGADVRSIEVLKWARDASIVDWLVNAGADVNAANADGYTALVRASMSYAESALTTVEALLERGALVNHAAPDGMTALLAVAGSTEPHAAEIVTLLLQRGADPAAVDEEGNTTVIRAAAATNENVGVILRALVDAGANAACANRCGRTALIEAAGNANADAELLSYLLECGNDVNAADDDGTTALMAAVQCWDEGVLRRVRLLEERGADGTMKNGEQQTACDLADKDNKALRAFLKKMSGQNGN